MASSAPNGSPLEGSLALAVCLVLALLVDIGQYRVSCSLTEEDLWAKYRPVAMDESLSVDGLHNNHVSKIPINAHQTSDYLKASPSYEPPSFPDELDWTSRSDSSAPPPDDDGVAITPPVTSGRVPNQRPTSNWPRDSVDDLLNVEEWQGKDIKDTAFKVPSQETSMLTKLIAGGQTPTFIDQNVRMPEHVPEGLTKKDRVLARYRFVVPIYVPAVKLREGFSTAKPQPIKFVKEQVTEMVPVKRVGTRVKEIIKAERVPQQVITDFVQEVDGKTVPNRVDDKVKPNERVVKSMVQNID